MATPSERVYGCSIERSLTGPERTVIREFTINRTSDPPKFEISYEPAAGSGDDFWLRASCRMLDRERGIAAGNCRYRYDGVDHVGVFLAQVVGDLLVARVLTDEMDYDSPRPLVFGPRRSAVARRFKAELARYREASVLPSIDT
jgi:hypothetical protein